MTMVTKGMVTAVLSWLEHVEALGFTPEQIDSLADEYLEVQGVNSPKSLPKYVKHGRHYKIADGSGVEDVCFCGWSGSASLFVQHLDDTAPTISTYCPPPDKEHTIRGDSIGMGVHERWYCSCGTVYNTRSVAEHHRDFANGYY